ncbi:MAG: nitrilase-related carbon-nitrogen hydrolase, partial [Steroidobacteraceae bacterium]
MPAFPLPLHDHGFVRVAACTPLVRIADPAFNLRRHTMALAKRASDAHRILAVFPELGLSGYLNDDLFFQDALLAGVSEALAAVAEASRELCPMLVVGAPLRVEHRASAAQLRCSDLLSPGAGNHAEDVSAKPRYPLEERLTV